VCQFTYKENVYPVPIEEKAGAGPLTQRLLKTLIELQTGVVEKPEW